jgi:pyruvate dehydrogenase E2 component (dihydrolipoamide acetyltransferase)
MPELTAAGERLSVLKAGNGEQVILLVHGFASDARSWSLNQPALAQSGATVYALDLPGHGALPAGGPLGGVDRLAEIVAAAAAALSPAPVHLVGHSMGGAIALAVAAQQPERVRALTLIAPAGLGASVNWGFLEGLLAMRDAEEARAALTPLVANPAILGRQIVDGVLAARNRPHTLAAWQEMAGIAGEIWQRREEAMAALGALPVPAQILWGERDAVLPPPKAALPGQARLHLLPALGHVPHMEGMRQANQLIAALDAA